jgi:alkylated DNA repair dioxygenase AlkB
MDLFKPAPGETLLPCDGDVRHLGFLYSRAHADSLYENLLQNIDWSQDEMVMFGKKVTTKRKVAWYGDIGLNYRYSNVVKTATLWTPELLDIKERIETKTPTTFNSCLLNLYHSGEEGMGWHSDDEPELGLQPVIGSLSLGASRRFLFRHRSSGQKMEILLESGSLLLMAGETQHYWQHSIPRMARVKKGRINLTFRNIIA